MFQLDAVTRRFGRQVLFERLSWRILPGARAGLVGPNGAGKTTLLRILAGLDRADDGAVHKPSTARIGYLAQEVETIPGGNVLSVVLAGSDSVAHLQERLDRIEHELSTLGPDDPRTGALSDQYGDLRHRFEDLDGDRLESRAKRILSGLGVPSTVFREELATLSGGWQMRVALARLLLGAPDLLLLDEPTNHLDLDAIAWLEEFLESYDGAFVVVSHDRYFLNRMIRHVVELERGRLIEFAGNYDEYLEQLEARREAQEKLARHQAREIAKVERFIERFRYKNTKARQVQSRVRALEKVERVDAPSRTRQVKFGFPGAPRSGDVVLRAEGVEKSYGDNTVYRGMDACIRRGDRVALVGPNGAGKSTLLKMVAGRVSVDSGELTLGHNVFPHYYAQHQLDALDPSLSVLEEMERDTPAGERPRLRKLLGCFLFTGDAVDKPVAVLSGGEKARLALAKMLLRPANLLLLDEPTNHLDLRSREVLEDAINEYDGTLIVVSHDRYFINRVATSIGEVGEGRIAFHDGAYDEYIDWKARREENDPAVPIESLDPGRARRDEDRDRRRREAEERNRLYRERKAVEDRLSPIEKQIASLEERARALDAELADPEVYARPERAAAVGREKTTIEADLGRLYAEWEELARDLPDE